MEVAALAREHPRKLILEKRKAARSPTSIDLETPLRHPSQSETTPVSSATPPVSATVGPSTAPGASQGAASEALVFTPNWALRMDDYVFTHPRVAREHLIKETPPQDVVELGRKTTESLCAVVKTVVSQLGIIVGMVSRRCMETIKLLGRTQRQLEEKTEASHQLQALLDSAN